VVPSIGNLAYEMKVHGHNIVHFPYADIGEFAQRPAQCAIPFSRPMGQPDDRTRLLGQRQEIRVQRGLGNVRGALPIHGLLGNSPCGASPRPPPTLIPPTSPAACSSGKSPTDGTVAFAHEYEMTYSLAEGVLEVRVTVTNLSSQPMPLMIGFHPYYRIPDIPRDEWVAHIPARQRWWPTSG